MTDFKIEQRCRNYFDFHIPEKAGDKVLLGLRIASLFTLVIPAVIGLTYGLAALSRRVSVKPVKTELDQRVEKVAEYHHLFFTKDLPQVKAIPKKDAPLSLQLKDGGIVLTGRHKRLFQESEVGKSGDVSAYTLESFSTFLKQIAKPIKVICEDGTLELSPEEERKLFEKSPYFKACVETSFKMSDEMHLVENGFTVEGIKKFLAEQVEDAQDAFDQVAIGAFLDMPSEKAILECVHAINTWDIQEDLETARDFLKVDLRQSGYPEPVINALALFFARVYLESKDTALQEEALVAQDALKPTSLALKVDPEIRDEDIGKLLQMKHLTSLELSGCKNLTDKGLDQFMAFSSLKSLKVSGCFLITDEGLKNVKNLPHLEFLDLSSSRIGSIGISYLAPLKKLRALNLFNCPHMSDQGLQALLGFPLLESLNVGASKNISDEGFKGFDQLVNLKSLELGKAQNLKSLVEISKIKSLMRLHLSNCLRLQMEAFKDLGALSNLRELDLNGSKVGFEGLQGIFSMENLVSLNLHSCGYVNDGALQGIGALKKLEKLNLSASTEITDGALLEIAKLSSLIDLNLSFCKHISDVGVQVLSHIQTLRSLDLYGCNSLTGEVLNTINLMDQVTYIDLSDCNKIPNEGLATLQSTLKERVVKG